LIDGFNCIAQMTVSVVLKWAGNVKKRKAEK
jgi:hypothetical protein